MIIRIYWSNECLTYPTPLFFSVSGTTDFFLQTTWNAGSIFVVPVVSQGCWPSPIVLIKFRIATQPEGINQIFNCWPWSQNIKAACQLHEYKMSLRAREAYAASVQDLSHHRNLSISYILSEVRGERHNSKWNLGSPSFNLADQTHLPTNLRSLTECLLTHLSTFSGAPPPLHYPTRTNLSIKSPQRDVNGEKRERVHWSGCETRCSLP